MPNLTSKWNTLLDWIARVYTWFYHNVLQFSEPFTRIFCRQEQNTPWLFWGLILFWIYKADSSWWGIPTNLFLLWFIHHIVEYRAKHPDNVPYKSFTNRAAIWAAERIRKRGN